MSIPDINFPLENKVMKRPHNFFNASSPVPPMYVKQIDVVSSQVLERILDGKMERFCIISSGENLLVRHRFVAGIYVV